MGSASPLKIEQLFSAWKKEARDLQLIRLQHVFIVALFILCLLFFSGWLLAPKRLTIYVPPDLSRGVSLKQNAIPKAYVYAFAYEIWQLINYWPQDGVQDYPANLKSFAVFLTPEFRQSLNEEVNQLQNSGQLQRQRFLQGLRGSAFDETDVKRLSPNTWEVDLRLHLSEYKNNQLVKDIEVLYPLKVTRVQISENANPYGLMLAGFAVPPQRLKTNQLSLRTK